MEGRNFNASLYSSKRALEYPTNSLASSSKASLPPPTAPVTDADFKLYLLYVECPEQRTTLSTQVINALSAKPAMKMHTLIQHTSDLVSLPAWLDTIPCLVLKEEKKAMKGHAAIEFIEAYNVKEACGMTKGGVGKRSTGHKRVNWDSEE